jgi:hypothetical protein
MDNRTILFMPDADTEALESGVGLAGCYADIVIAGDGRVYKDRDGDAPEVLPRLRTALASRDLVKRLLSPTLCGVPIAQVESLTLDGAHWVEPLGEMHWSAPAGGPVLTFRVAQAPGGKQNKAKFGMGNGDMLKVQVAAVRGVIVKDLA